MLFVIRGIGGEQRSSPGGGSLLSQVGGAVCVRNRFKEKKSSPPTFERSGCVLVVHLKRKSKGGSLATRNVSYFGVNLAHPLEEESNPLGFKWIAGDQKNRRRKVKVLLRWR